MRARVFTAGQTRVKCGSFGRVCELEFSTRVKCGPFGRVVRVCEVGFKCGSNAGHSAAAILLRVRRADRLVTPRQESNEYAR